jgi:hypothetical protein
MRKKRQVKELKSKLEKIKATKIEEVYLIKIFIDNFRKKK